MDHENLPKSSFEIDRRRVLGGAVVAAASVAAAPLAQDAAAATPDPAAILRACAVNFRPVQHDNKASAAKIRSAIEAAARDGVRLIVFPEMALQGFEKCQTCADHGSACEKHLATGELAAGPLMRELADVVRRNNIYAVVGFGERDPVKPLLEINRSRDWWGRTA